MTSKNSGGIVIYSTKGDIMFSSTGEITGHKKPPRKHRSQRNIAHKIFEDMRAFNKEEFWDNVLIKFSRNVFLNDFRFIVGILRCFFSFLFLHNLIGFLGYIIIYVINFTISFLKNKV